MCKINDGRKSRVGNARFIPHTHTPFFVSFLTKAKKKGSGEEEAENTIFFFCVCFAFCKRSAKLSLQSFKNKSSILK